MMKRIICHWTAGHYKSSAEDRAHYHFLVEGDGVIVPGRWPVSANENPTGKNYAAHTLNCNTGSIGVSLCCMAQAKEAPFVAGPAPMKKVQWDAMVGHVAMLCKKYRIAVTPETVLSHAEVQANLGIKQRNKWDYTRLTFAPSIVGARACGDKLRAEVKVAMRKPGAAVVPAGSGLVSDAIGEMSTPAELRALQKALNEKNYNAGGVDGIWGKMTRDAIMSFKADHGLDVSEPSLSLSLVALSAPRHLEMRAEMTVEDLRAKGSTTIDGADKVEGASWFAGAGAVGTTALSQFEYFSDIWYRIKSAFYPFQESFGWLLTNPFVYVIPVAAVAIYYARKVRRKRLDEFKAGKVQ